MIRGEVWWVDFGIPSRLGVVDKSRLEDKILVLSKGTMKLISSAIMTLLDLRG